MPQDIRDINNLTSIVALLKQQRQYTIAQPLVITLSSKIKHTIDYRSIPIESCMTVTGDGATCESTIVANGGFHLVGNNVKIQNLSLIGDGSCDYSNYAGIFGCQSFVIENVSVQNYMHGIVVEVDRDVCTCDYHSFCDGESCNERSLPGIETSVLESEIQQALSLTPKQVAGLQPESLKEYMTAIRSSLSPIPIAEPVTLVNEDDDSEDDEDFDPTELEEVEPPSETLCNNTIVNKVVAYTYERPTMICNNVQVRHCLVSGITVRGNQAAFNGNGAVLAEVKEISLQKVVRREEKVEGKKVEEGKMVVARGGGGENAAQATGLSGRGLLLHVRRPRLAPPPPTTLSQIFQPPLDAAAAAVPGGLDAPDLSAHEPQPMPAPLPDGHTLPVEQRGEYGVFPDECMPLTLFDEEEVAF